MLAAPVFNEMGSPAAADEKLAAAGSLMHIDVNGLAGLWCTVEVPKEFTIEQAHGAIWEKLRIPVMWQVLLMGTEKLIWKDTLGTLISEDLATRLQLTLVVEEPSVPSLQALLQRNQAYLHVVAEASVWILQRGNDTGKFVMAEALRRLALQETHSKAIIAQVPAVILSLVELLQNGQDVCKEVSARALSAFAFHKDNKLAVARVPGVIRSLIAVLQNGSDVGKKGAAEVLGKLAKRCSNRIVIGSTPNAIPALVLLLEPTDELVKKLAAMTLGSLALCGDNQAIIADVPESLPLLVALLQTGGNSGKEEAARTLGNLAKNTRNQIRIAGTPYAIFSLVALLQDGEVSGKVAAAEALGSLASNEDNQVIIGSIPDALPLLLALLGTGSNSAKQAAASALRALAFGNTDNQVAIALNPELIPLLLALLRDGDDKGKEAAADLLATLAFFPEDDETSAPMEPSPLSLVELLQRGGVSEAVEAAPRSQPACIPRAAHLPHAVPLLVDLLQKGTKCGKRAAAKALGNLSCFADDQLVIMDSPDVIPALLCLLREGDDASREAASRTLGNLALGNADENKRAIADVPSAIRGLVADLRAGNLAAAGVLGSLALQPRHEAIKQMTADALLLLVRVLEFLIKDDEESGQLEVAVALGNFAYGSSDNQDSIVRIPGAVPALVTLLEEGDQACREAAARALGNLAMGAGNRELIHEALAALGGDLAAALLK